MANFLTKLFNQQPERKSYPTYPSDAYDPHSSVQFNFDPLSFWGKSNSARVSTREALAHELVFRCLALKSLVVQDVLPMIQRLASGNEWNDDPRHPAMYALKNPNASNTFADVLAFLLVSEDVYGQAYLEILRSPAGAIVGVRPLDFNTVMEMPVSGAPSFGTSRAMYRIEDIAYYQVTEATTRQLKPENVLNLRAHDVRSPLAGKSAVSVALDSVGLGQSLSKYARAYLDAGGPSGMIKFKNRTLTPEQAEAVQEKWYQRYNLLRGKQTGRVAVFDEDGDYQQIGSHLKDLDNESLRMSEQAAICTALGTPGQLVQAYYAIRWGNQRAGQDVALKQFWELTISPTLSRYRQAFDKWFLSGYEPKRAGVEVRVFWDTSNVKGMQEDLDAKATRARADYAGDIVTLNEARAERGLKPLPDGDKLKSQAAEERAAREAANQPNNDANNQKKSLELKRKPTSHELAVVEAVRNAQDGAADALTSVLTEARAAMLQDALPRMGGDNSALAVVFPFASLAPLNTAVSDALAAGRNTVVNTDAKGLFSLASLRSLLVEVASAALVNQVKARLISTWARYRLRGLTDTEIREAVATEMRGESVSYVEELASGVGYQAIADGRDNGFDEIAKPGDEWLYSAILDKNTCEQCESDDLKRDKDRRKLPKAPNPLCLGRWRCRCMHVLVRD